jgi:ribose transport system permease protein
LLLNRSLYGRRVIAVGSNRVAARFSGVPDGGSANHLISGFCAACVGPLLAGFTTPASFDMSKQYLLSSIAVVILGGIDTRGGYGHLGILGGALTFTALGTMLAATPLPEVLRGIVCGVMLLPQCCSILDRRAKPMSRERVRITVAGHASGWCVPSMPQRMLRQNGRH